MASESSSRPKKVTLDEAIRKEDEIFSEPIGELVIAELPIRLLVIDQETIEVKQWVQTDTEKQ